MLTLLVLGFQCGFGSVKVVGMRFCLVVLHVVFCGSLLSFCGCSTESDKVGVVEGVVTLDGKPVDRATITFYPTSGRSSGGYTDNNGRYSLKYTRSEKGAIIGEHKVTISSELEQDYMGGADTEQRDESMPPKYLDRRKTDLTATVERGKNTIDFDLKSADF